MTAEERLRKIIEQVKIELTDGSLTLDEENWVKDYIKSNMFKDIEEILNRLEEARNYIKKSEITMCDLEDLETLEIYDKKLLKILGDKYE